MSVRRRIEGPSRRVRYGVLLAIVTVMAFAQISASAELNLPELPLPTATPLDLEELLNLDDLLNDLPAATELGEVVDGVTEGVSDLLGDTTEVPTDVLSGKNKKKTPAKVAVPQKPRTGSWSTDRLLLPSTGFVGPATRVSSNRIGPSYASAVGDGFSRAVRRAAELAGPVAAPMLLGLFAVGLLFVAARGPGRLVKVEEERKAFRERRTFRL